MKRTNVPTGTYLVFGPDVPPFVPVLTLQQQDAFNVADGIARSTSDPERYLKDVMGKFFGNRDITAVIPAWSHDAMHLIATQYEGAHQTAVRGIAAAIALGRTFSRDKADKADGDGGTRVSAPKLPDPKGPSGPALPTYLQPSRAGLAALLGSKS